MKTVARSAVVEELNGGLRQLRAALGSCRDVQIAEAIQHAVWYAEAARRAYPADAVAKGSTIVVRAPEPTPEPLPEAAPFRAIEKKAPAGFDKRPFDHEAVRLRAAEGF